ncbi:MAG: ATP-dependent DNA helicase RecQ, partial [Faecalibacterium sp.]|nr:ATP-dependent DNA helicase RecQ [Faecalibacterium sp.]
MQQHETPHQLLKRVFGYDSFRPGQADIVNRLLAGQDVLAVMPTGAGKSLCYQVPALLLPGVTVVVSPLVSLMQDQVRALVAAGVKAAYLNNSLTDSQKALMLHRAREGWYKIIYVAPERLLMPGFLAFARTQPVSMVVVDEAHCISQWGQDFRPSYLQINQFLAALPMRPVVGAFTATATAQVRQDIRQSLALNAPFELTASFDRPNLYFEVRHALPSEKPDELLALLKEEGTASGIVYCNTIRAVEEVTDRLQQAGYAVGSYHSKLPAEQRRQNQEDFLYDRITVMVATNAFGMGIDKPNVRYVIHYNMPKDLESYYQEAGRAGRDGEAARCVLLYSGVDVRTARFLIEKEQEKSDSPLTAEQRAEAARNAEERLKWMTFYSTTQDCLRGFILKYFGQQPPARCEHCGGCANAERQRQ